MEGDIVEYVSDDAGSDAQVHTVRADVSVLLMRASRCVCTVDSVHRAFLCSLSLALYEHTRFTHALFSVHPFQLHARSSTRRHHLVRKPAQGMVVSDGVDGEVFVKKLLRREGDGEYDEWQCFVCRNEKVENVGLENVRYIGTCNECVEVSEAIDALFLDNAISELSKE